MNWGEDRVELSVCVLCIPIRKCPQRTQQPQQGSEGLQTHHTWPSAPVAMQGLSFPGRQWLQCHVCSREQPDPILWLLCYAFSYFMWLCETTVPTSSFAALLGQSHCISAGQHQAGNRIPGNKARGIPAWRSPPTDSLN